MLRQTAHGPQRTSPRTHPDPAAPLLVTSSSVLYSYWLEETSVKRRAWLRSRPAGPFGRQSGAFRRCYCACARPQYSASHGAARSYACALFSRLPSPPPPERKCWGRGSSVSALFALDKMAKIAKTHEGKRSKSARGGALWSCALLLRLLIPFLSDRGPQGSRGPGGRRSGRARS